MPKDTTQIKAHRIEFRCTATEKERIETLAEKAGAVDVSEYVRALALNQNSQSLKPGGMERKGLIAALGQLGKIGSNVNQLAKAHNEGQTVPEEAIRMVWEEITRCGDLIRREVAPHFAGEKEKDLP